MQLKTSRGVLFLPPSDAYVRSFLYLLYTLIKLYYTKALSNQALSLALIEFFSSGSQESWCIRVIQQQPFTTLTSVHDYWKNHSFDYMDFCLKSDVSAF